MGAWAKYNRKKCSFNFYSHNHIPSVGEWQRIECSLLIVSPERNGVQSAWYSVNEQHIHCFLQPHPLTFTKHQQMRNIFLSVFMKNHINDCVIYQCLLFMFSSFKKTKVILKIWIKDIWKTYFMNLWKIIFLQWEFHR